MRGSRTRRPYIMSGPAALGTRARTADDMASQTIFLLTILYVLTIAFCAPSQKIDKDDQVVAEKDDLQPAASHWGGYGGYGHYGGYGGYGYPGYGHWGYPSYGYGWYGGWPYGGYYGHHGYWW